MNHRSSVLRRGRVQRAAFLLFAGAAAIGVTGSGAATALAQTRTVTLRSQEFTVGGFRTRLPKVAVPRPSGDGWITAMNVRLVRSDGQPVSVRRVMLHHVVFINEGGQRREHRGSCAGRRGEAFYGTGEERQRLMLPDGYGYRVRARERWRMQAMLMSHQLPAQRVRVQYTVRFVQGSELRPVRPFWIRVNGCDTSQPSYPIFGGLGPGSISSRTWDWRVPIDGHIVAVGGHLHGGARDMFLTDPECGGRRLLGTQPVYGPPTDVVYRMRPILHEPGAVGTRYFLSGQGIGVRAGQSLRLHADYDGQWPRTGVMSIMHVYVAPGPAPATSCPDLPADAREVLLRHDGTPVPPRVRVPLNVLGGGRVRPVGTLPGPMTRADGPAEVTVRGSAFSPARLSLPLGATLTWRFRDRVAHNAYFANGPAVLGTPTLRRGGVHRFTPTHPGRYQLFCYLHPVTMRQEVIVRPPGADVATPPTRPPIEAPPSLEPPR